MIGWNFFMKRMNACRLLILVLFSCALLSCSKNSAASQTTSVDTSNKQNTVIYPWTTFVMGADLSYVNEVENYGGTYKDSGTVKDPFVIFKSHGTNLVRVRLWNNPAWVSAITGGKMYSDLNDVEKTISRAKAQGMAVSLDLHYSDTWADPNNQQTPAAWQGLSLQALKDSVYQFTLNVLNELKSKNLIPEMIQIGNEINGGMLFPSGQVTNNNWASLAILLNSGIKAVRDFSVTSPVKPKIILHVAQLENGDWWFSNVTAAGVTDFDIMGFSQYFNWSTIPTMAQITSTISSLRSKYNKPLMIVETAYPWTNQNADTYTNVISGNTGFSSYSVSASQQYQYMKDFTQAVITGGGTGIMYWEPAWITSTMKDKWGTGSSWDNCTFFDFNGNALPVFGYMTFKYTF
jgi:arabinogalactan endo-1,4-beta-galactosidase